MRNNRDEDESPSVRNPIVGTQSRQFSIEIPALRKRTLSHAGGALRSPRSPTRADNKDTAPEPTITSNIRPFGNLSLGENALLQDIERREEEEMLGRKYSSAVSASATKPRSATVADELGPVRPRRASVESVDATGRVFSDKGSRLGQLIDFLDVLVPKLQQRINAYCVGFFLVCLLEIGGRAKSGAWMVFFICVVLIDCAMAIVDHSLFVYFINPIFRNHYKIAYLLHGFNGPFGILLSIIIIGEAMQHSSVAKSFPNWQHTIMASIIVVVCVCMKNWFTRKHYTALLEKRFVSKLFKLETWNILLSELATTKPPKLRRVSKYQYSTSEDDANPPASKKAISAKTTPTAIDGGGSGRGSGKGGGVQETVGAGGEASEAVRAGEPTHPTAPSAATPADSQKRPQSLGSGSGTSTTTTTVATDAKSKSTRPPRGRASEGSMEGSAGLLHAAVPTFTKIQKKVINVFADLVDATSKYNDEYEDDVDVDYVMKTQQTAQTGTSHNNRTAFREDDVEAGLELPAWHPTATSPRSGARSVAESTIAQPVLTDAQKWALKSQLRRRKTFWELAARISSSLGMLRIWTYNGPVTIQRKFQAKAFGRSLYRHLSRGGKVELTVEYLQRILQEKQWEDDDDDDDRDGDRTRARSTSDNAYAHLRFSSSAAGTAPRGSLQHLTHTLDESDQAQNQTSHTPDYNVIRMNSPDLDKDLATLLYESAVDLFDPFHVGVISEDQCVAALCVVYKEARFAASSLNEYGELHQSLRTVIDVLFWLVMLVVMQVFLQLDLFNYILPFITLMLTVSFALSTMLSNIFVAIVFVFFMVPYDIGSKVYIGADPSTRIVGFVQSVSLLYTTINTLKNEIMKIPNHMLYSENICNLQESGGCVFEILLCFNLYSKENESLQSKIDTFLTDLNNFVLVEQRLSWKSCFYCATGVSSVDNTVTYAIWITHRDNWQEIGKPLLDRTLVIQYVKARQEELGLEFVKIKQGVELLHHTDVDEDGSRSGSGRPTSSHARSNKTD